MLATSLVVPALSTDVPSVLVTRPHPSSSRSKGGDLRVEESVEGDIHASGHVCVPLDTTVHGNLSARTIQGGGVVVDTLRARERVVLLPAAEIQEPFQAPIVDVRSGAARPSLAPIPPGQTPEDLSILDAPSPPLFHRRGLLAESRTSRARQVPPRTHLTPGVNGEKSN